MSSESTNLQTHLRYSHASLASAKYIFTILCGASFAFTVLTLDHFFTGVGAALALLALGFAGTQTGLIRRRRWARRVAIGFSFLQIPSLAFPIAFISLRALFNKDVVSAFRSSEAPATATASIWRMHSRAAMVALTVFTLLVATGLVRRELRTRQVAELKTQTPASRVLPHATGVTLSGR